MPQSSGSEIALFPLQAVLLPGEPLPLHIFEERYKTMIARSRATGEPFGVVLHVGEGVAAVGCSARLAEVVQELPDGRLDIIVKGEAPFRLKEVNVPEDPESEPITGSVEYLEDEQGNEDPEVVERVRRLVLRVNELGSEEPVGELSLEPEEGPEPEEALEFEQQHGESTEQPAEEPASYRLASALDLEAAFKQRLLQNREEGQRLELLREYLEGILPRLELLASRREAIRGNGKGY